MKKLLLTLALLLAPTLASAQCNGTFPNNTVCGNLSGSANLPRAVSPASFLGAAGGTNGQIQYNNAGALGGFGPVTGDWTLTIPGGVSTLATVNANVGTFGSATNCVTFTVNAKGLITAASQIACVQVITAATLDYTPPWTSAVTYKQASVNANTVYMTDFMGSTTCDGTNFIGGTGGVSTTTLTVASVQSGTLAVGQQVGGTGVTTGTTIASLGTGVGGAGTYILSAPMTIATGTVLKGGTNQATNISNFLTAVATNGAATTRRTTVGVFAPGNCFVNTSPTITTNSNNINVNYKYEGYGTIITPNPSAAISAMQVLRGTFVTHGDEQRTITIEGLSIDVRNNNNAQWGFDVQDTRVYLIRVNCMAGDDGTTHNQVNFACFYWHQRDPTDPNTGAFYGKLFQSTCKGNGTGVSAVPICARVDGSGGNALVIAENAFAQGVYGLRVLNSCATVNVNCAYHPNNLIIRDNNIELFTTCIEYRTSVPTLSKLIGGIAEGNTLELCSVSDIDLTTFTQQSAANQALALGPNTGIGTATAIVNPNAIQVILPNAKQWP